MYKSAVKRIKMIQTRIDILQKEINKLPKGNLVCTQNGKYEKCYNSRIYIPSKDHKFAEKLAYRKLLEARLEDHKQELDALTCYVKKHEAMKHNEAKLMKKKPFCNVLSKIYTPSTSNSWSTQSYPKNTSYPQDLKCRTIDGNRVRSKSEREIYNQLYTNKLQFRYEWKQDIGGREYAPDFTILHPTTGELIYWEHFGLMDNPKYAADCFNKLAHYNKNGITSNINLITTFETTNAPLDSSFVKNQIEFFLL